MKIETHDLFYTPASQQEILDWIGRHSGKERIHLLTCMMMTWNYLATQVNAAAEANSPSKDPTP